MKKKLFSVLLTAAMITTLAAGCGSGSSGDAASSEDSSASSDSSSTETGTDGSAEGALKGVSLSFGTTALFAPFTYYDEDGTTLIGFDIDLEKALQDYLGFELDGDIQVMDYSALTTSLAEGKLDFGMAALWEVAEEIKRLRTIVEKANKDVQKQSDEILSAVVNSSIGFGYPNIEELKLGVTTQLSIDDQIKNQTKLSYISGTENESLPSSYNGLG